MKQPELGKWFFRISIGKDMTQRTPFSHIFQFSLFKLLSEPKEGSRISESNYKGVYWVFRFWFPIERI